MIKTPHTPDSLEISIGGYPGPLYSVKWTGQRLHYEGNADEYIVLDSVPHPRTWTAFWRAMDTVNAWKWRRRYCNVDILDGTNWSILISIDGKLIKSAGSNAYPGETPSDIKRGIPEKAFPLFSKAVRNLTKQSFY